MTQTPDARYTIALEYTGEAALIDYDEALISSLEKTGRV